ncbi:hypothetical protein TNIN_279401 [Trichonephila inaurata madagascariensis]|uniref:Uncharacterized protein n=1 Tax=Trichonephila inaurata madagascariensis TaxID=2747483 RepID=A0A8X6XTJ6_9ARAC|nr:hypothetical protein TNIN_279401 [Trichonephila inaurata madagascariensis]
MVFEVFEEERTASCKVEFEYICVTMPRKNLSVQEAAIFEELLSDDDSAASNNSDTDDEDYFENVTQGENISSNDERERRN